MAMLSVSWLVSRGAIRFPFIVCKPLLSEFIIGYLVKKAAYCYRPLRKAERCLYLADDIATVLKVVDDEG